MSTQSLGMSNKDLELLIQVYEQLVKLKQRWIPINNKEEAIDVDDAEQMWTDVPEALEWMVPQMGIALGLIEPPKLQIMRAVYFGSTNKTVDVIKIIRQHIKDNKIELQITNNVMDGDPEFGVVKILQIDYIYNDQIYCVDIKENEWLKIGV